MKQKAGLKKLVIVESPTKARTIRQFLSKDFDVISCMGHVRDLPSSAKDIPEKYKKEKWSNLGVNVDRNFTPIYCIPTKKKKVVSQLKQKIKEASALYLATDEDREGESISWHLLEVLKPSVPVKRMVFHEITKQAILEAINNTRSIDKDLVKAQEARRILDRLVGYTISPLLWKKISYGLSAGRVQSVAVQILTERELARVRFVSAEYWNLLATLSGHNDKGSFEAKLQSYDQQKIAKGTDFDPDTGQIFKDKQKNILCLSEKKAKQIQKEIKSATWKVIDVTEKTIFRKPPTPFITSTLQQDASRRFGWSASKVMSVAQSLYEQGHITYMRTDSTVLSKQALQEIRKTIERIYGSSYLSDQVRDHSGKKPKGAQEAHEAIRPSGVQFVSPDQLSVEADQLKLYDLIWKRTIASQMKSSKQKQVNLKIQAGDKAIFTASGTTIEFLGFLKVYEEGREESDKSVKNQEVLLPPLKKGEVLACQKTQATCHQTKPASRYTEASLIQTMEELGIGRPSTYAPTISTIIHRGYVIKQGSALVPTFTAIVVSHLLKEYLPNYVESQFTSDMEKSLDDIAGGNLDWVKYLKSIYTGKVGLKNLVEQQEKLIDPNEARSLKSISEFQIKDLKQFEFRVGKYGAYVCRVDPNGEKICASIPDAQAPSEVDTNWINKLIDKKMAGADALGKDPQTGQSIYLLEGRYGPYLQRGELGDILSSKKDRSIKRVSIPKNLTPDDLTLDQAVFLLSLPRTLGSHPETQKVVKLGNGQFGPYVVHEGDFRSIPRTDDLFNVDLKRALELLAQEKRGRGKRTLTPLKTLGNYQSKPVAIYEGRYGPYMKWNQQNCSLPKDMKLEDVTLEKALELMKKKKPKISKAPNISKAIDTKKKTTKLAKKMVKKASKITKKVKASVKMKKKTSKAVRK